MGAVKCSQCKAAWTTKIHQLSEAIDVYRCGCFSLLRITVFATQRSQWMHQLSEPIDVYRCGAVLPCFVRGSLLRRNSPAVEAHQSMTGGICGKGAQFLVQHIAGGPCVAAVCGRVRSAGPNIASTFPLLDSSALVACHSPPTLDSSALIAH